MKKLLFVLAALAVIFYACAPVRAMSWIYPITEVEFRPLDTTPIEYPIYVDIVNSWGVREPQHDGVTPNGWVVSNRDVASFGQMADAWLEDMGLYEHYELILVDTTQVDLPYIWPATPDEVGRREYAAIVITLRPLPVQEETTQSTQPVETAVHTQSAPAVAPVQLPATGQGDAVGLVVASTALLIIGLLARKDM